MKKLTLAILATILTTGCAGTRVGVYHDFEGDMVGRSEVVVLQVPLIKIDNVSVDYIHTSSLFSGIPFNHRPESSLNMIGLTYEFK